MEQAVSQINEYLDGNVNGRIECDDEGEVYRLFHSINSLAAVLNTHAAKELREKELLKNMISDMPKSHVNYRKPRNISEAKREQARQMMLGIKRDCHHQNAP